MSSSSGSPFAMAGVEQELQAAANNDNEEQPVELEHLIGYTGRFTQSVVCHPTDANKIVHSVGAAVVVGSLADAHAQVILRGHDENVSAISVSPNGALLASGQLGSRRFKDVAPVVVWDLAHQQAHRQLVILEGVQGGVTALAFSPDSRLLAAIGQTNNTLHVWDLDTNDLVSVKRMTNTGQTLGWGSTTATASRRNPTYTLCTSDSKCVWTHTLAFSVSAMQYQLTSEPLRFPAKGTLTRNYTSSAFSEDCNFMVNGSENGDAIVFSHEHNCFRTNFPVCSGGVWSCLVRGDTIFCGGGDGSVRRFRGRDTKWTAVDQTSLGSGRVVSMSFTADGQGIVAGTNAGKIFRISLADLSSSTVMESHTSTVRCVTFGSKPDVFVTTADDGSISMVDLQDYSVKSSVRCRAQPTCLVLEGASTVVAGFQDGTVRAFDMNSPAGTTPQQIWELPQAHRNGVTAVALGAKFIVTGGADGCLRFWLRTSRQFVSQFALHRGPVHALVHDQANPALVHSVGADRCLVTFDLKSETKLATHMIRNGRLNAMQQRLDGEFELITPVSDGSFLVWDPDFPDPTHRIAVSSSFGLNGVSISPKGDFLAVACDDQQVYIYDTASYALVAKCIGHSGCVLDVAWAPDQRQIVSVGDDSSIAVWNFYL